VLHRLYVNANKKHGESETSEPESPSTVAPLPLWTKANVSHPGRSKSASAFSPKKTKPKNTMEKLDTTKVEKTID